jgi:hypothetical protein
MLLSDTHGGLCKQLLESPGLDWSNFMHKKKRPATKQGALDVMRGVKAKGP